MRLLHGVYYYCVRILQVHFFLHCFVIICDTLPFKQQHNLHQSEVKILLAQTVMCALFYTVCNIFSKACIAGDLNGSLKDYEMGAICQEHLRPNLK
jgi:hypothetical protein